MIKLIATDMDGTLLNENSQLPSNFFDILKKLNDNNIKFVVASGRPYFTLHENFKPHSNEIYFICDNGAYIVEPGRKPIISILNKQDVNEMVSAVENIPNTAIILCGTKASYLKKCTNEMQKEISKYYLNQKIVDNLIDIDDDIFKVTICDFNNSAQNSYPLLKPLFGHKYKLSVSGEVWLDINNKNINKGNALKEIQKNFHISYNETMAFGDFYNDIELLQAAEYSFVMENANEDMKQYGKYIAESNKNNGVLKAIEKYAFNNG